MRLTWKKYLRHQGGTEGEKAGKNEGWGSVRGSVDGLEEVKERQEEKCNGNVSLTWSKHWKNQEAKARREKGRRNMWSKGFIRTLRSSKEKEEDCKFEKMRCYVNTWWGMGKFTDTLRVREGSECVQESALTLLLPFFLDSRKQFRGKNKEVKWSLLDTASAYKECKDEWKKKKRLISVVELRSVFFKRFDAKHTHDCQSFLNICGGRFQG